MPLVLVPTPLGNLGDMTVRARETLRDAPLIVAEDTRVAQRLLAALDLPGREIWSYREQNARSVTAGILARARESVVAVVTDAGMPGISDPGTELVASAHAEGIAVEVLPGPSAALGVAVLSGFPLERFAFEGFPPRTGKGRREAFARALALGMTTIWYESPQRIRATLAELAAMAPDARVFLVREYTKRFEQHLLGTPAQVEAGLAEPVRGEIAFAVHPPAPAAPPASAPVEGEVASQIDALLEAGESVAAIAKALGAKGLGERNDLYRLASERKRARGNALPNAESPRR